MPSFGLHPHAISTHILALAATPYVRCHPICPLPAQHALRNIGPSGFLQISIPQLRTGKPHWRINFTVPADIWHSSCPPWYLRIYDRADLRTPSFRAPSRWLKHGQPYDFFSAINAVAARPFHETGNTGREPHCDSCHGSCIHLASSQLSGTGKF